MTQHDARLIERAQSLSFCDFQSLDILISQAESAEARATLHYLYDTACCRYADRAYDALDD